MRTFIAQQMIQQINRGHRIQCPRIMNHIILYSYTDIRKCQFCRQIFSLTQKRILINSFRILLSWLKNILFDSTSSCANLQIFFLHNMCPRMWSRDYDTFLSLYNFSIKCGATSSFLWETFTTQYAYIGILSFYLCDLWSLVNNRQNYNNLHQVLIPFNCMLFS